MKKHSEIDMVVWWGMLPHVQEHAREQLDTSLTPCKAAGACASLLGGSSRVAIQPSAVLSTYSECVGHACFPYSASCTRVGAVQGASPRALFFFAGTKCTAPPGHATRASPCLASITSWRGALGAHAREDATSLHWRAGRLSTSVHFVLREKHKKHKKHDMAHMT